MSGMMSRNWGKVRGDYIDNQVKLRTFGRVNSLYTSLNSVQAECFDCKFTIAPSVRCTFSGFVRKKPATGARHSVYIVRIKS